MGEISESLSNWTERSKNLLRKGVMSAHTASFFFFFFLSFFLLLVLLLLFLGPLPRHMEVPRLGVESELQPPACARATATQDPSCICNLHHSSRQRRILNPLSKGRDRTRNLMVPSRIRQPLRHNGNSKRV